MAGELNGTNVFLEVFNRDTGLWAAMAGELSNSSQLTNGLIEITNKSSVSFTTFLEDSGTQNLVLSGDWVFNSDADFQFVRTAANAKTKEQFRQLRGAPSSGGLLDTYEGLIASAADTSPDGDKLTSAFTINMTGAFALYQALLTLKNSASEFVKNASGGQVFVRS